MYSDGGFIAAEQVILVWENKFLQAIALDQEMFNPEGKLQEFVQSKFKAPKSLQISKATGPDHRRSSSLSYTREKKISSGSE